MKRILFSMMSLLLMGANVMADNTITVDGVTLPQGGQADLVVKYNFDGETDFSGFQFNITLPENVSFVTTGGNVSYTKGDSYDGSPTCKIVEGVLNVACYTTNSTPISGTSGTLLTLRIQGSADLTVGNTYVGNLTDPRLSTALGVSTSVSPSTFNITVSAPLNKVTLDETSTTAPTASDGAVNVTVNRTINANEWSTICLPFDMTETQVTTAFGTGAQLRKLDSWSFEGEPTAAESFTLNFTSISTITKNIPCLIRVTDNISTFDVDGVVIDPATNPRAEGVVYYDETTDEDYTARLTGTYKAETTIPDKAMFLLDNQLWYSKGSTKTKAFRGYFRFGSVVLDAYNTPNAARVTMNFDNETTGISNRLTDSESNIFYNLQGQRVDAPAGGIFIRNGKKVIIK